MPKSIRATYVSLFVATAAAMLGLGIVEPILPIYARHLGASSVVLGMIFSGFALSRGFFAPFTGQYSDRTGRRKMMLIGLSAFAVLSLAYTWADSPWWMMLIRFLEGFASVLVTPIAQSYVGDITPVGQEGRYLNLFFISFFIGQALGPALGGYLTDHFSIDMPFYALAVMSVMAAAMVFAFVPESPALKLKTQASGIWTGLKIVLQDRQMQGVLTLMGSRGFFRWGFNTFFPVLALTQTKLSLTQVGFILSFYMAAGALVQYPAGVFSDRHLKHRKEILFYASLMSPLMMFLVPLTHSFYIFVAITLWMGAFSAIGRASAVAIRAERGRVHGMGVATGAFTTSLSLGQVLGPLAFGLIADLFQLKDAFYLGGVVGIVGSLVSYYCLRRADEVCF